MAIFCRAPGCVGDSGLPNLTVNPWLCDVCDRQARTTVVEAGLLYLAVREQLQPGSDHRSGGRGSAVVTRAPLRVDMLSLAMQSVELFVGWSDIVAGRTEATSPTNGAFARALTELTTSHDAIMTTDRAPAYAGDLRRWSMKVRTTTGLAARPRRLPLPCPVCDLRGIRWDPEQRQLRCGACGTHGAPLFTGDLLAAIKRAGTLATSPD